MNPSSTDGSAPVKRRRLPRPFMSTATKLVVGTVGLAAVLSLAVVAITLG